MATAVIDERRHDVPPQLRGWHWGAFFLSWIWALAHRQWLWAVLGLFIPLIPSIYLGAKGKEIAWEQADGKSVAEVVKEERTWTIVGLVLFALFAVLIALSFAFGGSSGGSSGGGGY